MITGGWDVVVVCVPVCRGHLRQSYLIMKNEDSLKVEGVVGRKVECAAVDIDMEVTVTGAWFVVL